MCPWEGDPKIALRCVNIRNALNSIVFFSSVVVYSICLKSDGQLFQGWRISMVARRKRAGLKRSRKSGSKGKKMCVTDLTSWKSALTPGKRFQIKWLSSKNWKMHRQTRLLYLRRKHTHRRNHGKIQSEIKMTHTRWMVSWTHFNVIHAALIQTWKKHHQLSLYIACQSISCQNSFTQIHTPGMTKSAIRERTKSHGWSWEGKYCLIYIDRL